MVVPLKNIIHRALGRFAEPTVLFPTIAVLLLGLIWTATVELAKVRYSDAQHAAAASNRELLGTYEAQAVRALREIDQSLNLVRYWHEPDRGRRRLAALKDKGLLPPDLIFTVSIANARGAIIDSTAPLPRPDVADKDYFLAQRDAEVLSVGRPPRGPADDANLQFSRRLNAADSSFDGVVIVTVGAGYFVSGYDGSKLGEHGVLAIVGTDGIVRVRRSGDFAFAGDTVNYAGAIARLAAIDTDATIS